MPAPLPHPNITPPPGAQLDPAALGAIFAEIQRNFDALSGKFPVSGGDLGAKNRLSAGIVTAAGAVGSGSGFTPAHVGTGLYTVELATEAPSSLSWTFTPASTENMTWRIVSVPASRKSMEVAFISTAGVLVNTEFHFLAKAT